MIHKPAVISGRRWAAVLALAVAAAGSAALAARPDPRANDVPPAISPPPTSEPANGVPPAAATQPAPANIACMLGVRDGWLVAQGQKMNGLGGLAWGPVRVVRMGPESAVTFRDAGTRMIVTLGARRYAIDAATGQVTQGLAEPGDLPRPLTVDPRLLETANENLRVAEQQLTASSGKLREVMMARALGEASEADLRAAQQQYDQDQAALDKAQLEMARLVAGQPARPNGTPTTQPRNHVPPIIIAPPPLDELPPTAPAPVVSPIDQTESEIRRLSVEVQAAETALSEARQRQRSGEGSPADTERAAARFDELSEKLMSARVRLEQLRRSGGTTPP